MRRFLKWSSVLAVVVLAALGGYLAATYHQVRDQAGRDEARPADAIVVLGAAQYNGKPSPVLRARLDHALALFKRNLARMIITTGSFGPDPNFSEAHVATSYLVEKGVPAEQIITEQSSETTGDIIRTVGSVMRAKGWSSAVVVSDGFHLLRLKVMFSDAGVSAYTSPAPESPIEESSEPRFWYSAFEVAKLIAYRIAGV